MPKTLADIKIRLYCQPPGTTGGALGIGFALLPTFNSLANT